MRGFGAFHHHADRGAVGELAGIAGGDELVLAHDRLQRGEPFRVGVRAVALVAVQRHLVLGDLLGLLVLDQLGGAHGHDLVVELAGLLRRRGLHLRGERILVLRVAADVVAFGDGVGGVDHRHPQFRLVLHQPVFGEHVSVEVVLDQEMDSRPPATMTGALSITTRCAAMEMVCRPDEQKRLTVVPPAVTGSPARIADRRAILWPGGAFRQAAAHDDVFDLVGLDPAR